MNHKELDVWKESIELTKKIYNITKNFPKEELYGLTSQIRRASVSIPSNIAEGSARNSDKEFIQFLYVSLGSLSELETQLIISKEIEYNKYLFEEEIEKIKKMILGLIKYLKNKNN
jgi:four helix bundle protein